MDIEKLLYNISTHEIQNMDHKMFDRHIRNAYLAGQRNMIAMLEGWIRGRKLNLDSTEPRSNFG